MYPARHRLERPGLHTAAFGLALILCALLGAGSANFCLAEPSSQAAFPSPDDAGRALASAIQEHDERSMTNILGGGIGLISSDDKAEDALEREHFLQKYREMHRWVRRSGGIMTLFIGAENWPFPIPLVSRNGKWRFDSKAGSDEILFRRIGENEVTAIIMCGTLVAGGQGTDSEANGLVETLLPDGLDASKPSLFHGYYFRTLPSSGGGFAAIAYPAVYRSSGVMTFIVTREGAVTEKDLGPDTARIAGTMTVYDADASWVPVESRP
jgi:Protein of unknown function (DUF2950)